MAEGAGLQHKLESLAQPRRWVRAVGGRGTLVRHVLELMCSSWEAVVRALARSPFPAFRRRLLESPQVPRPSCAP